MRGSLVVAGSGVIRGATGPMCGCAEWNGSLAITVQSPAAFSMRYLCRHQAHFCQRAHVKGCCVHGRGEWRTRGCLGTDATATPCFAPNALFLGHAICYDLKALLVLAVFSPAWLAPYVLGSARSSDTTHALQCGIPCRPCAWHVAEREPVCAAAATYVDSAARVR